MILWVTRDGDPDNPCKYDRYDVWETEPKWSNLIWHSGDYFWARPCPKTLERILEFTLKPGQMQKIEMPFDHMRRIGPLIDEAAKESAGG